MLEITYSVTPELSFYTVCRCHEYLYDDVVVLSYKPEINLAIADMIYKPRGMRLTECFSGLSEWESERVYMHLDSAKSHHVYKFLGKSKIVKMVKWLRCILSLSLSLSLSDAHHNGN